MVNENDCLFCRIAKKELDVETLFEDEHCVVFPDINPQAPHHYLVIPRQHMVNINDSLDAEKVTDQTLAALYRTAATVAKEKGLDKSGYRIVINNGAGAQQSVFHLHLHLLGGREMQWPPG